MVQHDGLIMGGSTGINVASAIKVGKKLSPNSNIVTILCDYGTRYQSKIYNINFLRENNLPIPPWLEK